MGILRDLFDIFVTLQSMKERKRAEYFQVMVAPLYEKLRLINEDFLEILANCSERAETTRDSRKLILELENSRLRLKTLRDEVYERSREWSTPDPDDVIVAINEQDDELIIEFLLACREYFQLDNAYLHSLAYLSDWMRENTKSDRISDQELLFIDSEIRKCANIISGRWRRVARAFVDLQKEFVSL